VEKQFRYGPNEEFCLISRARFIFNFEGSVRTLWVWVNICKLTKY